MANSQDQAMNGTRTEPVVDVITGAKDLSMSEKLKVLNQELRRLHKACTDAGYDADKTREVASPLFKAEKKYRRKKMSKILLYLFIASGIIAALAYNETSNFAFRVAYKKFMVNYVLPYWDWTYLFGKDCMVENPYYEPEGEKEVVEKDCLICENMTQILPMTEVDTDDITETIFKYKPVIVSDAMSDWRATKENLTLDSIIKLYATDTRTMNVTGEIQTNHFRTTKGIPEKLKNTTAFAKWAYNESLAGNYVNFTVQWSNVNANSHKALRYFYGKPYFLPNMCEPIRTLSYVMAAKSNSTAGLKGLILKPRLDDMGIWIAQVSGRFEFILNPVKICEKTCKKIRFVLQQGQILNVPMGIFQISYRLNSTEALGFAVGYNYQ